MSSALDAQIEIIDKEYHPEAWNIYTFYAGDGENWPEDNKKTINLLSTLKEINQMIVYAEISEKRTHPDDEVAAAEWGNSTFSAWQDENGDSIWTLCTSLMDQRFKRVLLTKPSHIWPSFKKIFGVKE